MRQPDNCPTVISDIATGPVKYIWLLIIVSGFFFLLLIYPVLIYPILRKVEKYKDKHPYMNSLISFLLRVTYKLQSREDLRKVNEHISFVHDPDHATAAIILINNGGYTFNFVDAIGRTPFYIACSKGNYYIVSYMLGEALTTLPFFIGNSLDFLKLPNQNKQTPLMVSIIFHHIPLALFIMKETKRKLGWRAGEFLGVNELDDSGKTALQHIVSIFNKESEGSQKDCCALVAILCENGADPSILDSNGMNAIHNAIESGLNSILDVMLATLNRSKNKTILQKCLNGVRRAGDTPLHLAVRYGQVQCIKTLLAYVSASDDDEKKRTSIMTALKTTTLYGRTVYDYILEHSDSSKKESMRNLLEDLNVNKELHDEYIKKKSDVNERFNKIKKNGDFVNIKNKLLFYSQQSKVLENFSQNSLHT